MKRLHTATAPDGLPEGGMGLAALPLLRTYCLTHSRKILTAAEVVDHAAKTASTAFSCTREVT